MKKRIIGIILTIALLCGVLIVPTGEQVSAKSKYTWDKKFNTTVNYKKLGYKGSKAIFVDSKSQAEYKGNFLEVGEKFKITFKNLPEGAEIELVGRGANSDNQYSTASILAYTQAQLDEWRVYPQTFGDDVLDWVKVKIDNEKDTATVYVKEPPKKEDLEHEIGMYQNGGFYAKDVLAYPCSVRLCFKMTETNGKYKYVSVKIPQLNLKEAVELELPWREHYSDLYR
ncbi:MAG: hypothetical protein K6F93_03240 [Lachnospiraceae bacterium]|nr:hypothetical protein [Lachnospiraceae bacterium]